MRGGKKSHETLCQEATETSKYTGPEASMKNKKSRVDGFYRASDPEESKEVKRVGR